MIALYYRVSTDAQDFASQHAALTEWLAGRLCAIYEDTATGSNLNRPALIKLRRDCQEGKIHTIAVYKLDRLSRNAADAIRFVLDLADLNVQFVSVTQPFLTLDGLPFRKTILAAFAEIAQIERETIVERVRAGLRAAKERGTRLGAAPKFAEKQLDLALRLHAEGWTYRQISEATGMSTGSLSRFLTGKSCYGSGKITSAS